MFESFFLNQTLDFFDLSKSWSILFRGELKKNYIGYKYKTKFEAHKIHT